ncbi:MAG TPA: class II aldolase [Eubacteriaceae bacterium]|jgi:L-fuculose-phosphate aldolase|nr:class II aldolase [Eubacteriaceae bacterium]
MMESVKKQVLDIAQKAERSGLCKHRAGNFSILDRETGYVAVTPSGIDREEMTHHDICIVDLEANVIESLAGLKPTSELLVHLALYKKRPDINAVAHTHSRFATSFAIVNKPIPAIVYECAILGLKEGYVPVAEYGRPGTVDLADKVAKAAEIADLILMESHGAVAVDKDPKEALLKANYVEELAEMYYRALTINQGKEPKAFDLKELTDWEYPKEIKLK